MATRPKLAIKISECIADWAEIESMLGILLALLLDTDRKAALAMYSAVDNRAAQLRMVESAAIAKLPADHSDVLSALLTGFIRPVMKERDKFVHWCWGQSPDLPDDLLLTEPNDKMSVHMQAIRPPKPPEFDRSKIFVVTEGDLARTLERLRTAKDYLTYFMGSVWQENRPEERASLLQKLSTKPPIQEALTRFRFRNERESSEQLPRSEPSA